MIYFKVSARNDVTVRKSATGHACKRTDIVMGAGIWCRFKNFFCLAGSGLNHVADWLSASITTVFRYRTNLAGLKLAAGRVMNFYLVLIGTDC